MSAAIKAEKKIEATYHPYAECAEDGCAWEHPESVVSREAAKMHVTSTGHSVRVIAERVALWGPK